jgi:hypothetical protein
LSKIDEKLFPSQKVNNSKAVAPASVLLIKLVDSNAVISHKNCTENQNQALSEGLF